MFANNERENPMLKDSNYKDYDTDIDRDITNHRKVCPICGSGKFEDNELCHSCQKDIREEFIITVWNNLTLTEKKNFKQSDENAEYKRFANKWSKADRMYIDDAVDELFDMLDF